MPDVHQAPGGGKGADPSTVPPPEAGFRVVLRDDIEDLYAAAEDATRPPSQRDLGRRLAREHIRASGRGLRALLASPPPPFSASSPTTSTKRPAAARDHEHAPQAPPRRLQARPRGSPGRATWSIFSDQIDDVIDAAEDATLPEDRRWLGPRMARKKILDARPVDEVPLAR